MHTRLDAALMDAALARIERSTRRSARVRTDRARLAPVHTLRVSAEHFRHDSVRRAGARALRLLQSYAPDSVVLALALRLPGFESLPTDPTRVDALLGRLESGDPTVGSAARLAHDVYRRVHRQLSHAPVQDLRIDFQDVAHLSDDDTDATAAAAGTEVALGMRERSLCPRVGIQLAPLSGSAPGRALRTLDLFVSTVVDRAGALPDRFVVSIPSVTHEDQVSAMVQVLGGLEARLGLARGVVGLEIGLVPVGAFDESGACRIPTFIAAASNRCIGLRIDPPRVAHLLGTRDPDASIGLRDLARLATAASPVPVCWGTSPDLPRSHGERGPEQAQRFSRVHAAWRTHATTVLAGMRAGYSWGWDTDAGQIPARLAAVTTYFLQHVDEIRANLSAAARGGVATDPGLIEEIHTGIDCGALQADDLHATGFEPEDFSWWSAEEGDAR